MKVLVTGASGFIGRRLCGTLASRGFEMVPTVRGGAVGVEVAVGNVGPETDWHFALLKQPDVVVHLAALVHVIRGDVVDSLKSYRAVNVEGSLNLARQAAARGVRRLVYLSSIKVNGETSVADRLFQADDTPAPEDPYGISKHEAEQLLRQIATETGMEVVIIRPPLVYGPGVKANFESMMRWLVGGVPLPLAAVTNNRRSLVALDNLVDLIITCLKHPAAANETFLVSDGEDLSTADLLRRAGVALGISARLFYVPTALLKLGATMVHRQRMYQRLCGSLQLDIAKTRDLLNWHPPVSVDEGLRRAVQTIIR
ncbi:UDP-glucose 4-epimerase family protein [Ferribacterium limneticum]|uniref:UDP-glucose 4-epimerase family protein n=1 Tax=Ferribacterium limneticum TaxID=76259 RepID=UPI001CFA9AFF|nr:SDR family oxidoreductase [Ferribacterium limneticum]UCV28953.1 SDR family oxidoreductase [Ferribacterium limneticum]UCV32871.1 SDR family oxidoreductase [Ferribacterium limneticum]